jgi:hypothetical protein
MLQILFPQATKKEQTKKVMHLNLKKVGGKEINQKQEEA